MSSSAPGRLLRISFVTKKIMVRGRVVDDVTFSDEKKFNLDGPDGCHSDWRDLRKELWYFSPRNLGGGSVMVWGAISGMGLVDLPFVSTKMNSMDYQDVLGHRLVPYVQRFPGVSFTFQQYSTTIHASQSTKTWLENNSVDAMYWLLRLESDGIVGKFSCVGFMSITISLRLSRIFKVSLAKCGMKVDKCPQKFSKTVRLNEFSKLLIEVVVALTIS
uniref:Zf-RVT domain-containing protein n=1 Tax=Heterorhabditis bacteriophora TaxID=37862 RepID=A0A1I7XP52_HETBA